MGVESSRWPADCIAREVLKSSDQVKQEIIAAASIDDVALAARIGKGSVYGWRPGSSPA